MQSVSQFICDLKKIALSLKKQSIQLIMIGINCKSIYSELLQTGGIQSTAEGEKVIINLKANVSGDILIFYEPKKNSEYNDIETMELIRTDNELEKQKVYALESLHQKFQGLIVVPKIIAGLISIVLSFFVYRKSAAIYSLCNYNIDFVVIQNIFPLVILSISFIFRKFIGFKAISILISLVNFIRKTWQRINNLFNSKSNSISFINVKN